MFGGTARGLATNGSNVWTIDLNGTLGVIGGDRAILELVLLDHLDEGGLGGAAN